MDPYNKWHQKEDLEPTLYTQLKGYTDEERKDAFYTNIAFGTAGMRGLLGAGTNRMNIYTVAKANLGYGKYILSLGSDSPKVAIAYDNRHMSKEFSIMCAKQLAQMGIDAYIFESLRPTPELSFAVRELGCDGGIVMTASHNPKEYNGYKVYDETGCQLTPDKIEKVIAFIDEVENELDVDFTFDKENESKLHWLGSELDKKYSDAVKSIQLRPKLHKENVKIVFTPQHGTAHPLLTDIFKETGYNVSLVKEQLTPDPDFSQTLTPNPEEKASYEKALELAKKVDADLILSTDPDADRMGIVVKHDNDFVYLTGNQGGAILLEYILSTLKERDEIPDNGVIFNTVVSSDSGEELAKTYGVKTEKTLTGFKYIGQKIHEIDNGKDQTYLFGYEESYGYLIQPFVRDKDALQACLMVAEAAVYYSQQNKTLVDVLNDVYSKIGVYVELTDSKLFEGAEGSAKIQSIMKTFRDQSPTEIAGTQVVYFEDYLTSKRVEGNETSVLDYPSEDVLKFGLEDGSWIAIRPSGTEPKCKFYYCIKSETKEKAEKNLKTYQEAIASVIT